MLSRGAFNKLRVGHGYAANNVKLSGLVQDLQLFRSALSKSEVLAAYKDNRYDLPAENPWRWPLHGTTEAVSVEGCQGCSAGACALGSCSDYTVPHMPAAMYRPVAII